MQPVNPFINLQNTFLWWYNPQAVEITQLDGTVFDNVLAVKGVVKTTLEKTVNDGSHINNRAYEEQQANRTRTDWLLFKQTIPDLYIPQINAKILDANGDLWFVDKITNMYFGHVYKLECELMANGVQKNNTVPHITITPWPTVTASPGPTPTPTLTPSPTISPTLTPTSTPTPTPTMTPIPVLTNGNLQVVDANPYYTWTPITNGWNIQNLTWYNAFYINSIFSVLADGQVVFQYNVGPMADGNIGVYEFSPGSLVVLFRNATGSQIDSYLIGNGPTLTLSNSFNVNQTVPNVASMNVYWRPNPTPTPTLSPTHTPSPTPSPTNSPTPTPSASAFSLFDVGENQFGYLGDNTTVKQSSLIQIGANYEWKNIFGTGGIDIDGQAYVWGKNDIGQLGLNDTINRSSPVALGSPFEWTQLIITTNNSGGIKSDGTLWLWGEGSSGQLGNNTTLQTSSPIQVAGSWSKFAIGNAFTAGIKTDGSLWTWGYNYFGSLGDNTFISRSSPVQTTYTTNDWNDIAVAGNTVLAIINGQLWGWGSNANGVTGFSGYTNITQKFASPILVNSSSNWSKIYMGGVNNYLFSYAYGIQKDGSLWSVGTNGSGQLGQNSIVHRSSWTQVGKSNSWSDIDLGPGNVIALKTDGSMWAWGENSNGQLGVNSTVKYSSPIQVGSDYNWFKVAAAWVYNSAYALRLNSVPAPTVTPEFTPDPTSTPTMTPSPTPTPTSTPTPTVTSSPTPSATSTPTPTPAPLLGYYTWGFGTGGVMGNNTTTTTSTPTTYSNDSLMTVAPSAINLTAGVVKSDGKLWVWGGNAYGVYGINDVVTRSTPIQVGTATDWSTVSIGTMGMLAVKTDGTLWGSGYQGVLGNGLSTNISSIVQIGVATTWSKAYIPQISSTVGIATTFAMKNDGSIWVTGLNVNSNQYGTFGNNNTTNSTTWIQGAMNMTFSKFATDHNYNALAIDSSGRLWGWGRNLFGELSRNNTLAVSSPVLISSATTWSSIAMNKQTPSTAIATKTDGTLWAWGRNDNGQVGNNSTLDLSSMVQIGVATDWDRVKGGNAISAAFKKTGSFWIWGQGANGRLGNNSTLSVSSPVQTTLNDTKWADADLSNTVLAIRNP